ncbi:histidine ammonia-lyase [Porticoccaceae bacterium LTM1]|nr:histidine ammonia-lyase [Porticoccaceae bacterium LTM1]
MSFELNMIPGELTLSDLRNIFRNPVTIKVEESRWAIVEKSRQRVVDTIESGVTVYGINTGFGRLAQTSISHDQLGTLQRNLVLSHATGVGENLDENTARLMTVMKIGSLMRGFSGIRREVIELMINMINLGMVPAIPSQGSVGASGDLAPLAHMSMPLIGEGEVIWDGKVMPAQDALAKAGLQPIELAAKEGLALMNGTQTSTSLALKGLFEAEVNFNAALVAGALSTEASLSARSPHVHEIHMVRGQPGQIEAARLYRELLQDSEINQSHSDCAKVQDPYCLRCQPQVMGAVLDQMRYATMTLVTEANGVTDNPLVFDEEVGVISGGNFHAEPVAMAADNLAIAISEIGALSERRIAMLIDAGMSQLPPFLVKDAGLNSGFMISHVTAAALASENKSHAHPASVDSLPTSANQEDHVSMATYAGRRLGIMNDNVRFIVAIELLAAAQGISLRRPLKSNEQLEAFHAEIRKVAAEWDQDRYFKPDIDAVKALIDGGKFGDMIGAYLEG